MFGIIFGMFIVLLSNIANGSDHIKCVSLNNQNKPTINLLLLICILMNKVKDFTTIHLQLN